MGKCDDLFQFGYFFVCCVFFFSSASLMSVLLFHFAIWFCVLSPSLFSLICSIATITITITTITATTIAMSSIGTFVYKTLVKLPNANLLKILSVQGKFKWAFTVVVAHVYGLSTHVSHSKDERNTKKNELHMFLIHSIIYLSNCFAI